MNTKSAVEKLTIEVPKGSPKPLPKSGACNRDGLAGARPSGESRFLLVNGIGHPASPGSLIFFPNRGKSEGVGTLFVDFQVAIRLGFHSKTRRRKNGRDVKVIVFIKKSLAAFIKEPRAVSLRVFVPLLFKPSRSGHRK
ncbi:hypothetical protein OH491_00295 [Termitidicoccus mucosus]|uniref:hypothetical protein n=1 Tax=Termitidicoccus mucosus TaxID=1184151 RepID=UPI0011AB376D